MPDRGLEEGLARLGRGGVVTCPVGDVVPPCANSMVTYGDERPRVMHEPTDFAAVLEDEDRERLR